MTTKNYKPHIFALSALFTLGNTIITLSGLSVCEAILLPGVLMITLLVSTGLKSVAHKNPRVAFLINIMVGVAALYGAVTAIFDYALFLKEQQSPQIGIWLMTIILAVVVVSFVACKKSAVYKYSLFAFFVVVAIIALCFVSGIKNFDLNNIKGFFNTNLSNTNVYLKIMIPMFVLPFFISEGTCQKMVFLGVLSGAFVLFAVTLQTLLTLGEAFDTPFAYLKAVGIISVGSLFTRLDGLVWFVFFVTAIIRGIICAKIAVYSVKLSVVDIYKQKSL